MKIKFISFFLILVVFFIIFSIVNLGKFLDVTQKPSSSDVIVCLSGSAGYRIKKALSLYQKGYSKSDKIIFTGSPTMKMKLADGTYCKNQIRYLKKEGVSSKNIIYIRNLYNTMQEILAVKSYLLDHNMKSVLIVSDAAHSRRIIFLANNIAKFDTLDLKIKVIASNTPWWDREHYYKNKKGINFAVLEIVKIPYNYIKYGILYDVFSKYGILESARKYLTPIKEYLLYSFKKIFLLTEKPNN